MNSNQEEIGMKKKKNREAIEILDERSACREESYRRKTFGAELNGECKQNNNTLSKRHFEITCEIFNCT